MGHENELALILRDDARVNNHDYAYKIVVSISGQNYGDRDYAAWHAWLDRTTAN